MRQRAVIIACARGAQCVGMALLLGAILSCARPDPVELERIVERDQLRREVAGFRALYAFPPGKLVSRQREVVVTVRDSLLRRLIEAAFPVSITIRNRAVVTITQATVTFRANVARVNLRGRVQRAAFPRVAADLELRGALDGFTVSRGHALNARITIDDIALTAPVGAPASLDPLVTGALQRIVERSLPEITSGLPIVAVPVRIDQEMLLPGFGPEGAFTIQPSRAPLSVSAARVIAFQDRIWIVLRVTLGTFITDSVIPTVAGAPE